MAGKTAIVLAILSLLVSSSSAQRVGCYYGSWITYADPPVNFQPSDIDVDICTHVFYAFAMLNNETHQIESYDPWNDLAPEEGGNNDNYRNTVALRERNPDLKVMISIGGWNEGSVKYSVMAANPEYRRTFIDSVLFFMLQFGFDGLDLDWEYPGDRGGAQEDVDNFITLLEELADALHPFQPRRLFLSVALGAGKWTIDHSYRVADIANAVDFVNVMTYAYHAYYDDGAFLGHVAPLYGETGDDETYSTAWSISYFLELGAAADKLNLGLPFYGASYTMEDPDRHNFMDPASGAGNPGPYSSSAGTLYYFEICEDLPNGWTVVNDEAAQVPYAYKGDQWVGYDNPDSISRKVNYALGQGLGGVFMWSVETDSCLVQCEGEPKCGLLSAIDSTVRAFNAKKIK